MGVVYLAHDEQLDRDVALKVLPPGSLEDETARKRFRNEALALAKLNHPNIETVFDFGTENGVDYLVTEYIPGVTLDAKLAVGALPEKLTLNLGAQLAEGLATAHSHNFVHRDLKPGNLRVTPDQRLKILDFGLARLVGPVSQTSVTRTAGEGDRMMGTLAYMSPEQVKGEKVDPRSDIWAVGIILYECATGARPFPDANPPQLIDAIVNQQPLVPSAINRRISPALENIVLKCLEKDVENRYQSIREVQIDLRRLSGGISSNVPVQRPKRRYRWRMAWTAAALLTVLLLLAWRLRLLSGRSERIESIAVLPLENLSRDSGQEYLADGMTEALITDLGQIPGLRRVISRTSVMRYKTDRKRVREIARELNVNAVVEGSILRSGDTVEVTARLLDPASDSQLWSKRYERPFRDLLSLQRELALTIANEIKIKLTPQDEQRLTTSHAVDSAAEELFLKANYLNIGTYEQRKKARQYYEDAVRADPNFAAAYAGLADSYWGTPDQPSAEVMPKAKEYAQKALSLDESLAHAHTTLAAILFYGDWDWEGADREFNRALTLNPNDAEAHRMYAVFLAAMTRFEQADGEIRITQALDPLSAYNDVAGGWTLYCARKYEQAAQQCQKALELEPNFDSSHACLGYTLLGRGAYPQAIAEFQKALDLSGGDNVRAVWLARAYAQWGDQTNARRILAALQEQSKTKYIPPYFFATVYAALGETGQALDWLEKAYSEHDLYLAWIKFDPALDPLRADARFRDLQRRLRL